MKGRVICGLGELWCYVCDAWAHACARMYEHEGQTRTSGILLSRFPPYSLETESLSELELWWLAAGLSNPPASVPYFT